MKLFVDDLRKPEDIYPGQGDDWHTVRTVTEAIRLLATQSVEQISIDHDIMCGGHDQNGLWIGSHTSPETYEPIAWYLESMLSAYNGSTHTAVVNKITLHSANAVGRKKMREILEKACFELGIPLNELPGCPATAQDA